MNGYFQIVNEETQTSVMLYPASEGGTELDIREVEDYLSFREIEHDVSSLYAAAGELGGEPLKVWLNGKKGRPEQEMLKVFIAEDNMSAVARFFAPSSDGTVMDKEEIKKDLKYRGVLFGICEEVLDGFLYKREYCRNYKVAVGKERKRGQDGRVEYFFNTDTKARPTLQEDGSVDFFHLNTINHCSKGDVLARLLPAVPSAPGKNVRGEFIPGGDTKEAHFRYGKNVEVSEKGNELIAMVNGHVTLTEGQVSVADVLEVKSVDNSTGNIEYTGSVRVLGNVCENFVVHSGGNVVVDGVVEGAEIDAKGDIVISRGMNGMGKGKIKAGGNVIAKFFENATVSAEGYVDSDSILHSRVSAGDAVHVGGKRGYITGGRICATNGVVVKTLGSAMGADTVLEIGASPSLKQRITRLQEQIQEDDQVIRKARPILATASDKLRDGELLSNDKYEYIRDLYQAFREKKKRLKKAYAELDELHGVLEDSKKAAVTVTGDVFAGTRIVIGDVSMTVKGKMSHCKFVRERGDVKMKGF